MCPSHITLALADSIQVPNLSVSTRVALPTVSLRVALGTSCDDLGLREPVSAALTNGRVGVIWKLAELRRKSLSDVPGVSRGTVAQLAHMLGSGGIPFGATYAPDLRVLLEMDPLDLARYEIDKQSARLRAVILSAKKQLRINKAARYGLDSDGLWLKATPEERDAFHAALDLKKEINRVAEK